MKKRNNSTPTKKTASDSKEILQQLISPALNQSRPRASLSELILLSEARSPVGGGNSLRVDTSETAFSTETTPSVVSAIVVERAINDPKLEKKVTFARLLNKVSAEMNSGIEVSVIINLNMKINYFLTEINCRIQVMAVL